MIIDEEMQEKFNKYVQCMKEAGCLDDVIICGSWAEYIYNSTGILAGFEPNVITMDMDIYIPDLKKPIEKVSLPQIARDNGYQIDPDRSTGQTIFKDGRFSVEFLMAEHTTKRRTRDRYNDFITSSAISERTNLGVKALQLGDMKILEIACMKKNFYGDIIRVPCPEAYAIHKMAINHKRGAKASKDIEKIENIAPYLTKARFDYVFGALNHQQQNRVQTYINNHDLQLFLLEGYYDHGWDHVRIDDIRNLLAHINEAKYYTEKVNELNDNAIRPNINKNQDVIQKYQQLADQSLYDGVRQCVEDLLDLSEVSRIMDVMHSPKSYYEVLMMAAERNNKQDIIDQINSVTNNIQEQTDYFAYDDMER